MSKKRHLSLILVTLLGLLLSACGSNPPVESTAVPGNPTAGTASGVKDLTIMWAEWDPANYLQQLVKDYEAQTGVKVTVVQEPWGSFGDRVFTEFAGNGTSFDLVVGDSQWLGQGSEQNHYVELTDKFNTELNGKALAPATVAAYAEYPKGSGRYWAYPTEGDSIGFAYRKDLFANPEEQAAFKTKYGYDLAVPQTWAQLRDIAEHFNRPDKNMYGVSIYTAKGYDEITMGFEGVLFSYGADWGDPKTYKVDGVLNSPQGVQALEMYKNLYSFVPPGSSNAFFQESNNSFTSGQVAMAMNFFAFFPALANTASNPHAANTGFFSVPAGPGGQSFAALGGQGMSINAHISAERQAAALEFLKWFAKDDVQKKWAELGGYTCNATVLDSTAFIQQAPYNQAFADSMKKVKDFWSVPVFAKMLGDVQLNLHNYVVANQGTAKETLDKIAGLNETALKDAGLLKASQ